MTARLPLLMESQWTERWEQRVRDLVERDSSELKSMVR